MASIGRLAPRPPWQPKVIGDIEEGPGGRLNNDYWSDGESRCSAGGDSVGGGRAETDVLKNSRD